MNDESQLMEERLALRRARRYLELAVIEVAGYSQIDGHDFGGATEDLINEFITPRQAVASGRVVCELVPDEYQETEWDCRHAD